MPRKPIDPGIVTPTDSLLADIREAFYISLGDMRPDMFRDLRDNVFPHYDKFFAEHWPMVERQGWSHEKLVQSTVERLHTKEFRSLYDLLQQWARRYDIESTFDDWEPGAPGAEEPRAPYWFCRCTLAALYAWIAQPDLAEGDQPGVVVPFDSYRYNELSPEDLTLPESITAARWDPEHEPWDAFQKEISDELLKYKDRVLAIAEKSGFTAPSEWSLQLRQRLAIAVPKGHGTPVPLTTNDPLVHFYIFVQYRYGNPPRRIPELVKEFGWSDETIRTTIASFLNVLNLTNREPDPFRNPPKKNRPESVK